MGQTESLTRDDGFNGESESDVNTDSSTIVETPRKSL